MKCIFCEREILNKGSLIAHQLSCKENPQRVKHRRGEGAGWPKGRPTWNAGLSLVNIPSLSREKYSDEEVFVENGNYGRTGLKNRILKRKLLDHCCSICGIPPEWQGKRMSLILDHINGINNDNRLENLRFVCHNCDSQLPTYKSRNRRKVKPIGDGTCLENS